MLNLLAIETATDACSAALFINDEIQTRIEIIPQAHARLILPMCNELLAQAGISASQLHAVAFGRGPGSFTGVRIATAVAQGIALAHDLPLIAISSLQALAQEAYLHYRHKNICAAIDARMQEIYWGIFHEVEGLMGAEIQEIVSKIENLPLPSADNYFGAGSAWKNYTTALQTHCKNTISAYDGQLFPTARAIILLALAEFQKGNFTDATQASPVYLRNNVVQR